MEHNNSGGSKMRGITFEKNVGLISEKVVVLKLSKMDEFKDHTKQAKTIFVLSGEVKFVFDNGISMQKFVGVPNDKIKIDKGVIYSMEGVRDSKILKCEE